MKLFQHSPLSHIGLQSAAVYAGAFAIGAATLAGFVKLFPIMSGLPFGVSFITFILGIPLCAVILTGLVSGTIALVRHLHAKPGGTGLQVLDHRTKLVVIKVAEDSPAQKSGIKVGDVIRDINERSVSSFSAEAVSRLLGDKDYSAGSVVSFNIERLDFDHKTSLRVAVTRAPLTTVKDQLDNTPENVTAGSNQMPHAAMRDAAIRVRRTTLRTEVRASTLQQTEVVYPEGVNFGSQQPAASSSVRQNAHLAHIADEDDPRLPAIGHGAGCQAMVAAH